MRRLFAIFCATFLLATQATAKVAPPRQVDWSAAVGGRIAPLGLLVASTYGYRWRLFNKDSLLLKDSHVALLGRADLTPTYAFLGARLQFEPLAVLRLWVDYQIGGFFGTLDNVQVFGEDFLERSAESQFKRMQKATSRALLSQRITLSARLQAKYKWVAARYVVSARRHFMRVEPDEMVWFNANLDLLSPTRGWTLNQDIDLLFEVSKDRFLAARYTQTAGYFGDEHAPSMLRRLGPAGVWVRKTQKRSHTFLLMLQWNLSHAFRNGEIQPVAMPMILAGWILSGHFVPQKKKPKKRK